jgi:hypothetical protein
MSSKVPMNDGRCASWLRILNRHKDELLVECATYNLNSRLFVLNYKLYLPGQEEPRRELELMLREAWNEYRRRRRTTTSALASLKISFTLA